MPAPQERRRDESNQGADDPQRPLDERGPRSGRGQRSDCAVVGGEHRGIRRRIVGRRHLIGGRSAEPLVEVQREPPESGRGEQRVTETILGLLVQERAGQSCGLVAMKELPDLASIGGPEHVAHGSVRSVVGHHDAGDLSEECRVPEPPGGHRHDAGRGRRARTLAAPPPRARRTDAKRSLLAAA